jgi:hypothetical protein
MSCWRSVGNVKPLAAHRAVSVLIVTSQLDASRLQAAMAAAEPRSDAFTMNHRIGG